MAAPVRPAGSAKNSTAELPHQGYGRPHGPHLQDTLGSQHPGDGGPHGSHLRETLGSVYFLFCCILFVLVFLSLGRTKLHFRCGLRAMRQFMASHHTVVMPVRADVIDLLASKHCIAIT